MNKRYLIVLTGIDGAGKSTQIKLLIKRLEQDGFNASYVYSRWEPFLLSPFLTMWKKRISGHIAAPKNEFNKTKDRERRRLLDNPLFRRVWFILFFIDYGLQLFIKIRIRLAMKRLIISDRIFYDSVVDQAIGLEEKKREMLFCILDSIWIKMFFPKPDVVIYLDCQADIAFSRKNDIPDIDYLVDRRELYLKLADKYKWITIDGTLPVNEVAIKIKKEAYKRLKI